MHASTATKDRRSSFALSALNRRVSVTPVIWALAALVLVGAFLHLLSPLTSSNKLGELIQGGDGPDYDCLAIQISKGHGVAVDWDDPDFRAPYEKASGGARLDWVLNLHGAGARTSRPPLLPVLMAGCYKVFGRGYSSVRVLMCLCTALAAMVAFVLLARRFGVVPGLIAATWFAVDPRSENYSHLILTEAPACLVVMLLTGCLLRTVERKTPRWACWLGVTAGLAFYTRTVLALWVPVLGLLVYFLARPPTARWFSRDAWRLPALVLLAFLGVTSPWMVRNCVLLRRFEPLGTMGSSSLAAAYSDEALVKKGVWFNLTNAGFFKGVTEPDQPPLENERVTSDYSKAKAFAWILHNPGKLPGLALMKAADTWRPPRAPAPLWLLIAGGIGALAMLGAHPRVALCYLGVLLACTLAVAVTWSVGDRFLVPVLPIIASLAGLGVWSIVLAATESAAERLRVDHPPRM